VKKNHVVKKGEYLSSIARKYGVSVSDLKTWNYIGKKGVKPGKKLVIYVPENESKKIDFKLANTEDKKSNDVKSVSTKRIAANSNKKTHSERIKYHKVRSGESLYVISKKYGVTINEIKSYNGLKSNNLQIGQTLKIPN
jgi:membrane-bound lytic murein transglycosylase D